MNRIVLQRHAMDDPDRQHGAEPDYEEQREREAAQYRALTSLRHECFYGAAAVGAAAGMLKAWHGMESIMAVLYSGVGGVVMVMVAGFAGGFCASVLRSLVARHRGLLSLDQEGGGEGPVIGGFGGAFLGLLLALLTWNLEAATFYTGVGTAVGSLLGGLPGEHVTVFIRMLAVQEHLERRKSDHDDADGEESGGQARAEHEPDGRGAAGRTDRPGGE